MTSEIRICIECKWHHKHYYQAPLPPAYQGMELHCTHPKIRKQDLVTGEYLSTLCSNQRINDSSSICKAEGRCFEPKENQ